MLMIAVPGERELRLEHLVLDANGTLTDRGALLDGVADAVRALRAHMRVHVLTADTFGTAERVAVELGATFTRVDTGEDKRRHVERLGPRACAAIGNGANDAAMLRAVALGIAVLGPEGTSVAAATAARVLCRSIREALELLATPLLHGCSSGARAYRAQPDAWSSSSPIVCRSTYERLAARAKQEPDRRWRRRSPAWRACGCSANACA